MERNALTADLAGAIIEDALLKIGVPTHDKVSRMLQGRFATFSDCYTHPEMLNSILKQLFGDSYKGIVNQIKNELTEFQSQELTRFIKILSQ